MGSLAEAFVPGVWAADVMLAEAGWAIRACIGSFPSDRQAEKAASKASATLFWADDIPGLMVVIDGQRQVLIGDQVEVLVLTHEARQRREDREAKEVGSTRRALVEADYESAWDNGAALALLLSEHGEGYAPRRIGVGVRWMPLDLSHEDELTEIVATGEEVPDSLREEPMLAAIADDDSVRRRAKD